MVETIQDLLSGYELTAFDRRLFIPIFGSGEKLKKKILGKLEETGIEVKIESSSDGLYLICPNI